MRTRAHAPLSITHARLARRALGAIGLLLAFAAPAASAADAAADYVGAGACAPCHPEIFERWSQTGHAWILRRPEAVKARDLTLPQGLAADDISYVVGGFRWKALFLGRDGYLVTSNDAGPGANQFNLRGRHWVDFRPGERVPYDCGQCHTTGYAAEGHQGGLPGIVGTWRFDGVQCESCHGPGARHARSKRREDIVIRPDGCSACHRQESPGGIPLVGDFLAPYTEVNQLEKSRMRDLGCTGCHDPHRSGPGSQRRSCASCHPKVAATYRESIMAKARVACIDCHMPPVSRIAEAQAETLRGDLRSHLFAIRHHEELPKRAAGGVSYNPGFLTVDHVCMPCHDTFESRQWAVAYASVVHRLRATTNVKVMRLQAVISYVGLAVALLAFFSGVAARGWIRPFAQVQTLVSVHRHAAWASFAIFVFMVLPCVFIHTPLGDLGKLRNLGWFLLHPANGVIGGALYVGKILAVRSMKLGWKAAGAILGVGLLVFWLVQIATIVILEFDLLKS
jgi:hypothetical protein